MEQLAPETVRVAARFGTAREIALGGHGLVVGAAAGRQVLIAVPEVEDLKGRIG
jgi:hypothetical protein